MDRGWRYTAGRRAGGGGAETSKDRAQKGTVGGVTRCGEVAQIQGGVIPHQFLEASYYEHHVNRRSLGSKPTLFLWKNILAFAVVTKAARDDFREYFAGVSHKGDATKAATFRPIFLLAQHLDRCIFPWLQHGHPPSTQRRFSRGTFRECPILRRPRPSGL